MLVFAKTENAQKMVVIRLARAGAKKAPFYNIVVTNRAAPRDGRFIERIGFSNPMSDSPASLRLDFARLDHWRGRGAQISPAVRRLEKAARRATRVAAEAPPAADTPQTTDASQTAETPQAAEAPQTTETAETPQVADTPPAADASQAAPAESPASPPAAD